MVHPRKISRKMKEVRDQRWLLLLSINVNCPDVSSGEVIFILAQVKWNSQERYFPVEQRNLVVSTKNGNTVVISFQDVPKGESTGFFPLPITKGKCDHGHCQDPECHPPGAGCPGAGSALIQSHAVALKDKAEKLLQPALLTPDSCSVSITCPWPSPELCPSDSQWCGRCANSTHTKIMFIYTLNPVEVLFFQCEYKAQRITSITWTMPIILN